MNVKTEKLNKIMEQVRQMLAVADHPNTGAEEADAFRTRAEALMLKYRIEESQLSTEDRALSGIRATKRTIRLCKYTSEFTTEIWSLAYWAVNHVDGRIVQEYERDENGEGWLVAKLYGFESDIRYAEMIFTAAQVGFSARLEPSINRNDSDQVNAYKMRAAGMERNRIAHLLWGAAMDDGKAHGKVQTLYKRECALRGEDPTMGGRGVSAKTYRESYSRAFVNGIYTRLWQLRQARTADATGEMVLASRKDEVDELYFQDYPHMRPTAPAEGAGEAASNTKKPRAVRARRYRARPNNVAAEAAGRDAASRVDLTGGNAPQERRMDRKTQPQIGG